MFSPTRKLKMMALLCGVLFTAGLTQLFLLRFEAGNIYPTYSSLRSDPLGTRALFESLNRMSADSAGRNYRPWHQIEPDQKTTLIMAGLGHTGLYFKRKNMEKLLERLAQSGGRLVMTFSASSIGRKEENSDTSQPNESQQKETAADPDPIEEFVEEEAVEDDATAEWDGMGAPYGMKALGIRINSISKAPEKDVAVRFAGKTEILPLKIPWRSPLYFEPRHNSWETLYTWQNAPVVVQRPWGKGWVVMAADSYLLSNEALRNHRATGFLAWLAVPGQKIIFDEFHKGLVKQPGVAGLARQYRLHGVFVALLVVTVLFVWRQAAIFVPTVQSEKEALDAPPTAGRDTSQGMVHLLQQHIGPKALLEVCFQTWKAQAAHRVSPSRIDEVKDLVRKSATDPRKEIQVQTYKQICELLKQGKYS